MPLLTSPISEIDTHIVLPVAKQIAHYICSSLNISSLIQNNIVIDTGWTSIKGSRDNHSFRTRGNALFIGLEVGGPRAQHWDYQTFLQATGHGTIYGSHFPYEYPKLFYDDVAQIGLYEMVLPLSLTFNCALWFNSRNQAFEAPERLFHRFTPGVVSTVSLTYDYSLPKDIMSMLFSLYRYRKFEDPTTFKQYLNTYQYKKIGAVVNRATTKAEIVVEKYIMNALISFEFEGAAPTPQKQNDHPDYYEVPFVVRVQFEKTTNVIMDYPVIVDNTLLPENMIVDVRPHETPIRSSLAYYPLDLFDAWLKKSLTVGYLTEPIVMPYYDDWNHYRIDLRNRSYRPFYQTLYTVDGDTTVIDLAETLGEEYTLHPIVKEVLLAQGKESFQNDVLINISCYMQDTVQNYHEILLDGLTLTIPTEEIHTQRRLVLSEITNLKYLNPKWYYLLEKYPDFFVVDTSKLTDGGYDGTNLASRIFRFNIIPRGPRN